MLVVGGSDSRRAMDVARALPDDGMMICLEGDRAAAARAVEAFARGGLGVRVSVMIGDPSLFIRKVAGPFDVIIVDGAERLARLGQQLRAKLAPGGTLTTQEP